MNPPSRQKLVAGPRPTARRPKGNAGAVNLQIVFNQVVSTYFHRLHQLDSRPL
jgi:hypothetical protein